MYEDTTGKSAYWFALCVRPRFERAVVRNVTRSRAKLRLVLSIAALEKSALLDVAREAFALPDLPTAKAFDLAKGA